MFPGVGVWLPITVYCRDTRANADPGCLGPALFNRFWQRKPTQRLRDRYFLIPSGAKIAKITAVQIRVIRIGFSDGNRSDA